MSYRNTLDKLVNLAFSAERETDKIVFKLEKLESEMAGYVREAAYALAPVIRQEMRASLARSGLQRHTGELEDAVENCRIIVSEKGFRVEISDSAAIRRAAALNFGWVSGGGGRSFKKLVKAGKANAAGVKAHPARKFLFLDDAQVAMLNEKFNGMVQAKIDKAMNG